MAVAIQLPALSPTMSEGRITRWLRREGDEVPSGTAIAECETDKSNLEIETADAGVLLKILAPEGATVPVGATIAWLGRRGEDVPQVPAPTPLVAAPGTGPSPGGAPAAAAAPAEARAPAQPEATGPLAPPTVAGPPAAGSERRVFSSPLARRLADEGGLDVARIAGSGPGGRVVRRDVEAALAASARSSARRASAVEHPLSAMRKAIATRLAEVKHGVPHFYLSVAMDMGAALELREEAVALGTKVSVNDIVVRATALAVRRCPSMNQVFLGDRIAQLGAVDVGVAVALDDGLVTPIVRDADTKGLLELAAEVRELAERARRRALKPEEYAGGSITVSNLGMFGIDSFLAVINPPQAAILAVGRVAPRPVVREGQVVVRSMMDVTLSGDHRVIDGAIGARFLQELKGLLEHPLRMAL
jgi:pyruvate dehydrogenase E2 component (dihydrolipoamide acetyltransferase)